MATKAVLNRYEHAPMLLTWFTGRFCIVAGIAMAAARFVHCRNNPHRDRQACSQAGGRFCVRFSLISNSSCAAASASHRAR